MKSQQKLTVYLFLILSLVVALYSTSIANDEDSSPTSTYPNQEPVKQADPIQFNTNEIVRSIDSTRELIISNQYPLAISKLISSLNLLKEDQKKLISSFFPKSFGSFKLVSSKLPSSGEYLGDSVNIIFAERFINSQGYSMDVNVLFLDPSINEYVGIINNLSKVSKSGGQRLEVVTIKKKYSALKKSIPDSNYYELNIVVNKDTLLNIITNGSDQPELINNFCNQIDINKLDKYLSK